MLGDGEASPEVYIIASTIEEAATCFQQAASFIRSNSSLEKKLKTNGHLKTISFRDKREGFIKVLSGDRPQGKFGLNSSCVITDEIGHHSPFQREIHADLQYSGSARLQPIHISISTSSNDLEGYGYEIFKEAVNCKNNAQHDPTLLPVIYSAPMDADPFDPEVWKACCPSLGETILLSNYEEEARRAKNSPRLLDEFCTYRLCQWRSAATTWIPSHVWQKCKTTFKEQDFHGEEVFIGLDAGSKHDLFAYVLLRRVGDDIYLMPRAFIPRENAKMKERYDGVPYTAWEKQGYIYLTDGDIVDLRFVQQKLIEDMNNFNVRECGYDPAAGAELLMQEMQDSHGLYCISESQNFSALSPAAHYFEELVYKKQLHFNDNACLDWCMNNSVVKVWQEKVGLDNTGKGTARNDLIQATIIGLRRCLANFGGDAWGICQW